MITANRTWLSAGAMAVAVSFAAPALADHHNQEENQAQAAAAQGQPAQQAQAQPGQSQQAQRAKDARVSDEQLQQTWSLEQMFDDADVIGPTGDDIGSVENVLLNEQGQIVALIAQVGGFWDIGDTHVAIPWDQVQRRGDDVHVPVTEENVDDFSIFDEEYFTQVDVGATETVEDDLDTGPNLWKATSLLNDYAVLQEGAGYGYVDDLSFDQQGQLQAIVVDATEYGTPGFYAYPWYGYGYPDYTWDPGLDYYALPYGPQEISEFSAFEYHDLYY